MVLTLRFIMIGTIQTLLKNGEPSKTPLRFLEGCRICHFPRMSPEPTGGIYIFRVKEATSLQDFVQK